MRPPACLARKRLENLHCTPRALFPLCIHAAPVSRNLLFTLFALVALVNTWCLHPLSRLLHAPGCAPAECHLPSPKRPSVITPPCRGIARYFLRERFSANLAPSSSSYLRAAHLCAGQSPAGPFAHRLSPAHSSIIVGGLSQSGPRASKQH